MKTVKPVLALLFLMVSLTATAQERRSTWVALSYGYNSQGQAMISSDPILVKDCEATNDIIGRAETLRPITDKISAEMKSKYSGRLTNGLWMTELFASMEELKAKRNKIKSTIAGVRIVNSMTVSPAELKYTCDDL